MTIINGHHGLHKRLVDRFGRGGEALYTFVACLLALAASGFAAFLFKQPLFFPSLGPTAFLFFETPMDATASPRNTLIGHFVAILAGALSLAIFGLLDHPSVLQESVTLARVGAAALSVALTGAVLLLLRSSHPPTGATTLIVSLGLLQTPHEMAVLMAGVVLLTVVGWIINRAAGFRCRSGQLVGELNPSERDIALESARFPLLRERCLFYSLFVCRLSPF